MGIAWAGAKKTGRGREGGGYIWKTACRFLRIRILKQSTKRLLNKKQPVEEQVKSTKSASKLSFSFQRDPLVRLGMPFFFKWQGAMSAFDSATVASSFCIMWLACFSTAPIFWHKSVNQDVPHLGRPSAFCRWRCQIFGKNPAACGSNRSCGWPYGHEATEKFLTGNFPMGRVDGRGSPGFPVFFELLFLTRGHTQRLML